MWTLLILSLSVIYLLYRWYASKYDYFVKRGIPATKAIFPFGNIPNGFLFRRNVLYDIDDVYQQYRRKEPIVGYFEAKTPKFMIISPEAVRKVLISNFSSFHDNEFSNLFNKEVEPMLGRNPFILKGQEWKEKRAEITPAFTNNRLRSLFPLVEEVLTRFTKYVNVEYKNDNNKAFDVREICAKFTVDVVSSCIFNADAQSFTQEKPEIREMGRRFVDFTGFFGMIQFVLMSVFPGIQDILKFRIVDRLSENFFINLMKQAVQLRESSKIHREDYLSFLMELRKKKALSDLDMAAHGVTFFTDGFETSSLAIAHILYELAASKKVQDKLRNQINEELIDENGKIIYEKMLEHEYLNQIFYEALRLHQPLGVYNRECTEEITLEFENGKRCKIEKGMGVNIPINSIHRDPDYYQNPDQFKPERFDPENGGIKAFKDRGVLIPFGDGPRICLGKRFAIVQVKAAVIEIIKNFELSVNEKTQRPLVIDAGQFLNIKKGGLWINMKPIK